MAGNAFAILLHVFYQAQDKISSERNGGEWISMWNGDDIRKKMKEDRGVIILEATIYFPIVIFTVIAMIYFGMMKYQQSVLTFQVEKTAILGGREVAYQGYEAFETDQTKKSAAVDLEPGAAFSMSDGAGTMNQDIVKEYYELHSEHLYNEWKFNYSQEASRLKGELEEALTQKSFLTGVEANATVDISNYVIGKSIKVTATYGLKNPRFLSMVGVPLDLKIGSSVIQNASNPTELVRNIDLAGDLITFLLERFGVKDQVDGFLKKVEDIKNKIL